MIKGVDLTLMIGPAVPIPVGRGVLDAAIDIYGMDVHSL
jgi:hypothetical protein